MDKRLSAALKIVISGVLLYFVITKLDLNEVRHALTHARPGYLAMGLGLFIVSKMWAAFRLNHYFKRIGVTLATRSNLKLYLLGMFYNLFLPGGIGGDAYKGYLIRKYYDVHTKKVVAALVWDRLSGLLLLFLYACLILPWVSSGTIAKLWPLSVMAIFISVYFFWWVQRRYFPYVLPIFVKSLGLSALVQMAQLLCAGAIMIALGIVTQPLDYLFIFLVSSIVAVVPFTIGGIGSRELTFYYGADLLHLDVNTAIGISILFFCITALVSLIGGYYHFTKPEKLLGIQEEAVHKDVDRR